MGKVCLTLAVVGLFIFAGLRPVYADPFHWGDNGKTWSLNPRVDMGLVLYQQTSFPDLYEWEMTPKLSAGFEVKDSWSLGLNVVFHFGLLSSPSHMKIHTGGGDFNLGFCLREWIKSPWTLWIRTGFYYNTSFPSSPTFGFNNILGPQLYPEVIWVLPNLSEIRLYLKFSPVFDGSKFRSLDSAQIEASGNYLFPPFKDGKVFSIGFDLISLRLQDASGTSSFNSWTLTSSYGF